MPSDLSIPRRIRVDPLVRRPLALGLALALVSGSVLADRAAVDVIAGDPAAASWSREAFLAENAIPWGHPAAAGVLAALERVAPDRPAGAIAVSNCNDSGPGSLRQAFADAVSGDVVDLTGLTCSDITLTSGALVVTVDDLVVNGPGTSGLTSISAAHNSSLIVHTGNGLLDMTGVTLLNGGKYTTGSGNALGGCINSVGSVRLRDSAVKYCVAQAQGTGVARGGAIRAVGDVTLLGTLIAGNSAEAASGDASGGGVVAGGMLTVHHSTVRGNTVETGSSNSLHGRGSGIAGYGSVEIMSSTISGNSAPQGGAVLAAGDFGVDQVVLLQSTVANNTGTRSEFGAGLRLQTDATLIASTVSGNREIRPDGAENKYGGGITMAGGVSLVSYSNVISGNITVIDGIDYPSDLGRKGFSPVLVETPDVNVISAVGWAHDSIELPVEWWRSSAPGLGALAWNGGPTQTMLPLKGSALINANPPRFGGKGGGRRPAWTGFRSLCWSRPGHRLG